MQSAVLSYEATTDAYGCSRAGMASGMHVMSPEKGPGHCHFFGTKKPESNTGPSPYNCKFQSSRCAVQILCKGAHLRYRAQVLYHIPRNNLLQPRSHNSARGVSIVDRPTPNPGLHHNVYNLLSFPTPSPLSFNLTTPCHITVSKSLLRHQGTQNRNNSPPVYK
jgi:hypothetical protein